MNRQQLKNQQAPLKEAYLANPAEAVAQLYARGIVDFENLRCRLVRPAGDDEYVVAGLHPKAGGDGSAACSGDLLMQSLASCAGVTLAAVAVSMALDIHAAEVEAVGLMDFRGTLAVSREVPTGLSSVEMIFHLHGRLTDEQADKLIQLVERYCVVLQTLKKGVAVSSRRHQ